MFENSIELGATVKADHELPGALLARLDFNSRTEFFTDLVLETPDIRIACRRLAMGRRGRFCCQGLFYQQSR